MTPELTALVVSCAIGAGLVLLVDRGAHGSRFAGEAILLGLGASAAILFTLSSAQIAWSRKSFGIAAALVLLITWIAVFLRPAARPQQQDAGGSRLVAAVFHAATIAMLLGYATFATLAPMWEADFISDWGLKGRTFFEAEGIDWRFLERTAAAHPDYPPLVPLTFDLLAVARGQWNDATLGLINVAFAAGLLLVIHGIALQRSHSRPGAAFATMAVFPLAAAPWIGIADGPFIAYATSALLLVRENLPVAATLLGLSAATKNEGVALIVAAAVGLIAMRRVRDLRRLWPAIVIPAPWLVLRAVHRLSTDIAAGHLLSRIFSHVSHPETIAAAFRAAPFGRPLFFAALVIGIAIVWRPLVKNDGVVLIAIGVQLAFYVAAYLATPYDVGWHVRWSWERLIAHLTPVLSALVIIANIRIITAASNGSAEKTPT